jgi:hypothetical protein
MAGHGGSWLHMAEHQWCCIKPPTCCRSSAFSPQDPTTDCPIDCPRDCPWSTHSLPPFKTHNSHRSASNSICYHHREARPHSPVAMGAKGSSRTVCLVGRQLFVPPIPPLVISRHKQCSLQKDLDYPILPLKIYYRLLGLCNPSLTRPRHDFLSW